MEGHYKKECKETFLSTPAKRSCTQRRLRREVWRELRGKVLRTNKGSGGKTLPSGKGEKRKGGTLL